MVKFRKEKSKMCRRILNYELRRYIAKIQFQLSFSSDGCFSVFSVIFVFRRYHNIFFINKFIMSYLKKNHKSHLFRKWIRPPWLYLDDSALLVRYNDKFYHQNSQSTTFNHSIKKSIWWLIELLISQKMSLVVTQKFKKMLNDLPFT